MNTKLAHTIWLCCCFSLIMQINNVGASTIRHANHLNPYRYIVTLEKETRLPDLRTSVRALHTQTQGAEVTQRNGFVSVRFPDGHKRGHFDIAEMVQAISSLPGVVSVDPVGITVACLPDDPLFPNQWNLRAPSYSGWTIDIDADRAHSVATGSGIRVGIIDSGIQIREAAFDVVRGRGDSVISTMYGIKIAPAELQPPYPALADTTLLLLEWLDYYKPYTDHFNHVEP